MSSPKSLPYRDVFDSRTEAEVREEFSLRTDEVGRSAIVWLAEKKADREGADAYRREMREERSLFIAESALSSAKRAERWAMWAQLIAIIAIAIAVKDHIIALLF